MSDYKDSKDTSIDDVLRSIRQYVGASSGGATASSQVDPFLNQGGEIPLILEDSKPSSFPKETYVLKEEKISDASYDHPFEQLSVAPKDSKKDVFHLKDPFEDRVSSAVLDHPVNDVFDEPAVKSAMKSYEQDHFIHEKKDLEQKNSSNDPSPYDNPFNLLRHVLQNNKENKTMEHHDTSVFENALRQLCQPIIVDWIKNNMEKIVKDIVKQAAEESVRKEIEKIKQL